MTTTRCTMRRIAAAPLMALAVLFGILGQSAVEGAYHAGTGSGGGTILFARNDHWYTIAPNGTHLHMLLSSTAGCSDFGCGVFSPDGTRIMAAAQTADRKRITTAIVNASGSGYHALPLPGRSLNLGPGAWSPDEKRLALRGWDDSHKSRNGIYAVNASDGRKVVRLTTSSDGRIDDPLAYSPDGSRLLLFHEGRQQQGTPLFGGLFETTAGGSGRIRLNPPGTQVWTTFGSPASWSPDGRQIAFTAFAAPANSGVSAVFVEDANGTHRRRITPWAGWSISARWSPDGAVIVFDKLTPGLSGHNLFLIHPNGTGLKEITFYSPDGSCCAVWSPDGKKLLTIKHDGFLITMNRDGSGMRRLAPNDAKNETAEYAWGP